MAGSSKLTPEPKRAPREIAAGVIAAGLLAVMALAGCDSHHASAPTAVPPSDAGMRYTVLSPSRALSGTELDQTVTALRARASDLGVTDAQVEPADDGQSVLVAVPVEAQNLIGTLSATGTFEIRPVFHTGPSNEQWAPSLPAGAPALTTALGQYRLLTCGSASSTAASPLPPSLPAAACDRTGTLKYLVQPAAMDRSDVRAVASEINTGDGGWAVDIAFTPPGQQRFTALTAASVGQRLALVVDGVVQSAPTVDETIPGDAAISGNLTRPDAQRLAAILGSGSLPAPLRATATTTTPPPGYHG
ncbi:hypothetical protein I6A60_37985 [Frankia sp. AgB1.9]|uniref:SecDF P1 head subdomain-containing protein n=1 Tax=unclassified Frankia TaxID=2632575 RepID=UPI00193351A5|nr:MULTISPECIES: hypothetical protein [unclassified Frankia]MBL7493366.1 hypothetical protein [Frankia sp. AgW1.1]MBL7553583.1 hypothetical protein [Frankia sp. AgB1.9]MBL7621548.1 hypothetical protein [Frankia sp. AgB1.8]